MNTHNHRDTTVPAIRHQPALQPHRGPPERVVVRARPLHNDVDASDYAAHVTGDMCALTVVRGWFRGVVLSGNHVRGSAALSPRPKPLKQFRPSV
jgi:hypothetical protein